MKCEATLRLVNHGFVYVCDLDQGHEGNHRAGTDIAYFTWPRVTDPGRKVRVKRFSIGEIEVEQREYSER